VDNDDGIVKSKADGAINILSMLSLAKFQKI
jgi:hypothetical protein